MEDLTLRDALVERFSKDELVILCEDAGIKNDMVPYYERGIDVYAHSLIQTFIERGRLPELLNVCAKKHPDVPWSTLSVDIAVPAGWPERTIKGRYLITGALMIVFGFAVIGIILKIIPINIPLEPKQAQVAIAEFAVVDATGKPILDSHMGKDFSKKLYKSLLGENPDSNCARADPDLLTNETCFYDYDKTKLVTDENVYTTTRDLKVGIVFYGVITKQVNGDIEIAPSFYISAPNFDMGAEVVGKYELGSIIQDSSDDAALTRLSAGYKVLRPIVEAMRRIQFCDYSMAYKYLDRTKKDGHSNIIDDSVLSVVDFLIGNIQLLSWSKTKDEATLDEAYDSYQRAMDHVQPNYLESSIYPRAVLGKSYVEFYRSAKALNTPEYISALKKIEKDLIDDMEYYKVSGNTQALLKSHLLLGRIYLELSDYLNKYSINVEDAKASETYMLNSRNEFTTVINLSGPTLGAKSILVARAYFELGNSFALTDPHQAEKHYIDAITHIPEAYVDFSILYNYKLADMYKAQGKVDLAKETYQSCLSQKAVCVDKRIQSQCRAEFELINK